MTGTVLILGPSGKIGSHAARAFDAAGWEVRRYRRGTDMTSAAQGVDVIVNGLNPPNYHDWARQIPAITAQVIAAARASGATVIVPGNVYVYGTAPGPWSEETPQQATTRKLAVFGFLHFTANLGSSFTKSLAGLFVCLLWVYLHPDKVATFPGNAVSLMAS